MRGIERVDIAVRRGRVARLGRDPIVGQPLLGPGEMAEDLAQQPGMGVAHDLAEVGDLADLPQEPHGAPGPSRARAISGSRASAASASMVVGLARPAQAGPGGGALEALQQRRRAKRKSRSAVAPDRARFSGSKRWSSIASTSSGSSGRQLAGGAEACRRSCAARRGRRSGRARPAAAGAARGRRTCTRLAKATWSTSMLSPMPMASVATR